MLMKATGFPIGYFCDSICSTTQTSLSPKVRLLISLVGPLSLRCSTLCCRKVCDCASVRILALNSQVPKFSINLTLKALILVSNHLSNQLRVVQTYFLRSVSRTHQFKQEVLPCSSHYFALQYVVGFLHCSFMNKSPPINPILISKELCCQSAKSDEAKCF